MFLRCGKLLVVFALVLATGLHWAALQTVAWASMLAGNLRTDSFSQAVDKTFGGQHPCPLCKAIAAAQRSEKKSTAIAPALKIEFPLLPAAPGWYPPKLPANRPPSGQYAAARFSPPLVPPPRRLPA